MTSNNISSPQELVAVFIREATDAAQLAFSLCENISAPDEVIKAIEDTIKITEDAAASGYSEDDVNRLNWNMHVVCSCLYLNVQRISRKERGKLSPVITAYKNMMFHFSVGQMQLYPILPEQFVTDITKHANILNDTTQRELTRLSSLSEIRVHELANRISEITVELSKHIKTTIHHSLSAQFLYIADELRQMADRIGETADTLYYLADEYRFFSSKLSEIESTR